MGRKLKGKNVGAKGLKGALARHSLKEEQLRKLSQLSKAQQESKTLKQKSMSGGNKKKTHVQHNQKGLVPFTYDDRIILVGEGDFSYALSIVKQGLIYPENVIATSYDSKEELVAKYPNVEEHLRALEEAGCQILHEVDATNLETSLKLVSPTKKTKVIKTSLFKDNNKLNYIMFNFPHSGKGIKDMERNIVDHQKLIDGYFNSCKRVFEIVNDLKKNDLGGYITAEEPAHSKIVLTLFEGEPYNSWNIKILGRGVGYRVQRSGKFDWGMFPEYHHRRTNSTRDTTKPASERDARVYVFEKLEPREKGKKKDTDDDSD
ncbi:uncharacterized protein CANTADRAFT_6387 [Suhomyces tanzawaensis NRRL Y-17324]|uniref:25S rRNA (uridine-N(3))-methyltransferase BMT5-like domain-containing protein n=1 Tax=Suhomyces tanzawaensis NRRL Y-17324 TaxID=984487 RepID=A0A1E4SI85_9ASCO|nr:uncharacterized protein CANTADRAFT_6387 [Suhomyces tanzawaensis NRRL Y-17324]ODV79229.1 hypothetical protein CANTADRAFT_6387 [Suhomyces tanzawaensis NRRL Y-17324]